MNAAAVLLTPLRSTDASTRWLTVASMGFMLALSLVLQLHQRPANAYWLPSIICACGEMFVGMSLLAPCLLLAIDGKQWCPPRVQRYIVLGMIFYALLWIAIPSLLLSVAGGDLPMVTAMQASGLVTGLALGLLPRVFVVVAWIAPTLFSVMNVSVHYSKKLLLPDIWMVTAVLIAISALCWRRQLRIADPYRVGFGTSAVIRTRLINRFGVNNGSARRSSRTSAQQVATPPSWWQGPADLRGTGPQHPSRSLRVALGGWLMPSTWRNMLWKGSVAVLLIPLFIALLYLRFPHHVMDLWRALAFYGWSWLAGFASMLLGMLTAAGIQQRWLRPNAELSILALLPGLGRGPAVTTHLLRASLLPTMCLQFAVAVLLSVAAVMQHANHLELAIAVLAQITAFALAPACVFAIVGGHPLPAWMPGAVAGVGFAMVGVGTGILAFLNADASAASGPAWVTCLLSGWLILLAFLCWLGQRGWRGLWNRPHPFLPGA